MKSTAVARMAAAAVLAAVFLAGCWGGDGSPAPEAREAVVLFARELGVDDPQVEEVQDDPSSRMFDTADRFVVTHLNLTGDGAEIVEQVETIANDNGFEVRSGLGGGDYQVTATKGGVTVKVSVPNGSGTNLPIMISAN